LRTLIGHAHALPATAPVELAQREFARLGLAFLAVLDGERLLGVCARRELDQSLGSRYGFALNARRPVREHVMAAPLRVETGTPIAEVFKAIANRGELEFFDDVLLVTPAGGYVGLIPARALVRLQTEFFLGNIARLEASRREIAAKNREMESDLLLARQMQISMLPATTEPLSASRRTLRLAHVYQPAGGVSGDFFDIVRISERALGVIVCDVMGHGVRSALITAMIRAMIEEMRPIAAEPGALLTRLNRDLTRILRQNGELIFVTAAYAVLSLDHDRLRYVQAGHPAPLRWNALVEEARPVAGGQDCAGPALGLMDDFEFAAGEEPFGPGDRLLLFTDGLFEAANASGEEFGVPRLSAALAANARHSLEDALGRIVAEASAHGGGAPFGDDVCAIAAEVMAT
jgi:serine phosphatase RsbU (regulator of sigma subunit)